MKNFIQYLDDSFTIKVAPLITYGDDFVMKTIDRAYFPLAVFIENRRVDGVDFMNADNLFCLAIVNDLSSTDLSIISENHFFEPYKDLCISIEPCKCCCSDTSGGGAPPSGGLVYEPFWGRIGTLDCKDGFQTVLSTSTDELFASDLNFAVHTILYHADKTPIADSWVLHFGGANELMQTDEDGQVIHVEPNMSVACVMP